jgi:hypothetical protein
MDESIPLHPNYSAIFDPTIALAAAKRAALWDLPRRFHRFDGRGGSRVSPDLAAFDAAIDSAPVPDEEISDDTHIEPDGMNMDLDSDSDC